MSISIVVAVVSAFVSLVAVAVSLKTASEQRKLARHLAEEEHRLLFEQVRVVRDSDIIRWTAKCVSILAEIESEVAFSGTSNKYSSEQSRLNELCHKLSALIDQGRMYFPNQAPESKGGEKPPAYQGYRQVILTVLVRIYGAVEEFDPQIVDGDREKLVNSLSDYRRRFVSEAQLAIDPRRYIALKEMNDVKAGRGLEVQDLVAAEKI